MRITLLIILKEIWHVDLYSCVDNNLNNKSLINSIVKGSIDNIQLSINIGG